MSAYTWVRKALDVARLPRVRLNNIQDLPGAKKKVSELTTARRRSSNEQRGHRNIVITQNIVHVIHTSDGRSIYIFCNM